MYKLIILDDECEIRNGLRNYYPWEQVGFEVAADFEQAGAALAYLRKNHVDAILTDIRIPDIDGMEFIEMVRKLGWNIPIVVLSGYRDFEYARRVMACGVRYYIVKPARFQSITEVFQNVKRELDQEERIDEKEKEPERMLLKERVHAYIVRHYDCATLNHIAEHVHMNPSYLSTLFHQQTGIKLYDYLLTLRMERAAWLLLHTDASVGEVAKAVGYHVMNSFARAFRQIYGVSPREYRTNGGK